MGYGIMYLIPVTSQLSLSRELQLECSRAKKESCVSSEQHQCCFSVLAGARLWPAFDRVTAGKEIYIHDLRLELFSSALYISLVYNLHPGLSSDQLMPHWLKHSIAIFLPCSKVHSCMKQGRGNTGRPGFLRLKQQIIGKLLR